VSGTPVIVTRTTAIDSNRADRIPRYSMLERINHWLGGVAYLYLLITGLAFWSPFLFWLAAIVGGGPTARFTHPIVGLIYFASMIWMFVDWRGDMQTIPEDVVWKENVKHYIRNEDELMPPAGRFNWGQKIFFWVMFYAVFLLLISGVAMWWVESIPWLWLRQLAIVVHVSAALITIGAFIIHVYMSTEFVPGSMTAMVEGDVSPAWARKHHSLWYQKITRGPRR
jgi:formate dehydrogenase subunit gamma